jgi:hypothetical protein
MKKTITTICIFALLFGFVAITPALAADKKLTAEISSVVENVTRNGNPYIRAIMLEKNTIDGISYEAGTPLMFFRENYDAAKDLKAGDTVTVIARHRVYQDRPSWTVLKVVEINPTQ